MLGGTNSNNACAVPRETKCEHATPLVPLEQSAIETIPTYGMMPRSGRKGKHPNKGSKYAPAKRGKKENLTKDDIPTIVEAVLNAMEARGNTNCGSEPTATRSSGRQVTRGSDNTGLHHARRQVVESPTIPDMTLLTILETTLQAPPTRTLVSIITCCPNLLNIVQAVPLRETKVFFVCSLANL